MQLNKEQTDEIFDKHATHVMRLGACVLDKEDFFDAVQEILSLMPPKEDTEPQLQQASVIGWVAFKDKKPNDGDKILVVAWDGTYVDYKIYSPNMPMSAWKEYYWCYISYPPFL